MEYQIALSPLAQKDLGRISDPRRKDRITVILLALRTEPELGKKLKGELEGYYSHQVWPYRIIYQIIDSDHTVLIVRIKDR